MLTQQRDLSPLNHFTRFKTERFETGRIEIESPVDGRFVVC